LWATAWDVLALPGLRMQLLVLHHDRTTADDGDRPAGDLFALIGV